MQQSFVFFEVLLFASQVAHKKTITLIQTASNEGVNEYFGRLFVKEFSYLSNSVQSIRSRTADVVDESIHLQIIFNNDTKVASNVTRSSMVFYCVTVKCKWMK